MARGKIVGPVAERVIELSTTYTNCAIADRLREEFGVSVTSQAIGQFLKGIRKERAERTRAVVQEHISATVPADLQTLDAIIAQEKTWFDDEGKKLSERLAVAKELRQTIDVKLKYSGAAEEAAAVVGPLVIVRGGQGD